MRHFVFTATTGRSGTTYLSELLGRNIPGAQTHHERAGYLSFGIDSPDASHFTLFNSAGNVAPVQEFWRRKNARMLAVPEPWYIETSHLLLKAGLLENIASLTEAGQVTVIVLERDIAQTVISFVERHDFVNSGFTYLWALDWHYPNKIVDPTPLHLHGTAGAALWYVLEMRARAAYYRLLLADHPNLRFLDANLAKIAKPEGARRLLAQLTGSFDGTPDTPGRANETKAPRLSAKVHDRIRDLIARTRCDTDALARGCLASGRRLADGHPDWRARFERGET